MESSDRVPSILAFVHAAEQGSFVAAARALDISASAVSKNISNLERSLGVRLLNRTTRSIQLTSEGQAFFERARIAIDALDHAIDSVIAHRIEPVGKVRISTASAIGSSYLIPAIPELLRRYPALNVEVDFDDRKVDLVRDGYDLALRVGWSEDSSLISRQICPLPNILVASPEYLQLHGVPKTRDDLASHQNIIVRYLTGKLSPWLFHNGDGKFDEYLPEFPVLTVSAPFAALEAAVLDMGIAQVGVHQAWQFLQKGQLKVVLPGQLHSGQRRLSLQYPHRALVAPRVRVTVDFLLEKLSQHESLNQYSKSLDQFVA